MNKPRFFTLILAVIFSLNLSARDFFIATNGNDQNPGTKIQPLASLNGARDLIRQLQSLGKLNEEVRVMVSTGMYFMTEPLLPVFVTFFDRKNIFLKNSNLRV